MIHRGILIHPQDISPLWPKRLKQAGIDRLGFHPVGGPEAPLSLERMLKQKNDKDMISFLKELDLCHIEPEYEMHALGYLLPEKMYEDRPDFFPMDEYGIRKKEGNMCASNQEALAYLSQKSYELAKKLPSPTHRYHFWLNDLGKFGCQCPSCRLLSPSDQQMILLHAMLDGIHQFDSQAKLSYLAYWTTLTPPEKIQPRKDIFLEFAPMGRDFHHPICDSECDKNKKELQHLSSLLHLFGTNESQVLDYWMDNSLFSDWKRPPKYFKLDTETMKKDVSFYKKLGFSYISSFGCYLGPDYEELYGCPPIQEFGEILQSV